MTGDLLACIAALERRVGALERGRADGAPRVAAVAPAAERGEGLIVKGPSYAPVRRLAVGEELHCRFQQETTVESKFGPQLAIIVSDEGGRLETVSCAHRDLEQQARKAKLAAGDRLAIRRDDDVVHGDRRTAQYSLRVERARRGVFD